MFHVHVACEPFGPALQTCTFIRSLLPLTHPCNADAVAVTYSSEYRPADVLLVERAWSADLDAAEILVARAKLDGVPLVYSLDDSLLDVDLIESRGYMTSAKKAVIAYLARAACGLIVSTRALRDRMAEYNSRIAVVPNAVDERLFAGLRPQPSGCNPLVIGYMGTITHDADLTMVLGPLRDVLSRANGQVVFEIVGGVARPETLAPLRGLPVKVVRTGDSVDYPAFMRWLAERPAWDLAIAPLIDSAFNRCKSDLKFLDYGALGVPAVCSNITPYRDSVQDGVTGLLADNTPAAWHKALQRLVDDADLRASLGRNARQHVLSRCTLRHTARQWITALRMLADKPTPSSTRRTSEKRVANISRRPAPPLLVVVPGAVNYFHNRAGQRIAAAARAAGVTTEVHTLQSLRNREGGCVVLMNPAEAVAGHSVQAEALAQVLGLASRHERVVAVSLECAHTHWHTDLVDLCDSAGIDTIIDLGFVNQYAAQRETARTRYRFVINGLTADERRLVQQRPGWTRRPIPWLFVGHHSVQRANVVDRLVRDAAPGGMVYLPALSPVTDGGPHINEQSFLAALSRSAVQVWCSHHDYFYLESERFRMSLLAGCVPVKAVPHPPADRALLPFHYLMPAVADLPEFLRNMDLPATWARFVDEFLALPSLEEGIAEVLTALGVAPAGMRTNGTASKQRIATRREVLSR